MSTPKTLILAALAALAWPLDPVQAGPPRVVVGVGVGAPVYRPYYPYGYYGPRPYYVARPGIVIAAPPVYIGAGPAPVYVQPPPTVVYQQAPPGTVYQQAPPPGTVYQQAPPGTVYQQAPPPGTVYQQAPPGTVYQQAPQSAQQPLQPANYPGPAYPPARIDKFVNSEW